MSAALRVCLPTLDDASALLAFELDNRGYFEHWINARPAAYYQLDAVRQDLQQLLQQHAAGSGFGYLLKAEAHIVGRINLTRVERDYFNRAQLGYRIGEAYTGRGHASAAVAQALQLAFERHGLWRLEAQVRPDNTGSLRVLQRNGFQCYGTARQAFCLHGHWHDLQLLECRAPGGPSQQRSLADQPAC